MSDDNDENLPAEPENLTRKEYAKFMRRKAYLKAKERQKNDPKFQEMKERARRQRREAYQKQKEYRKKRELEKKQDQENKVMEEEPEISSSPPPGEPDPVTGKKFGHLTLVETRSNS